MIGSMESERLWDNVLLLGAEIITHVDSCHYSKFKILVFLPRAVAIITLIACLNITESNLNEETYRTNRGSRQMVTNH